MRLMRMLVRVFVLMRMHRAVSMRMFVCMRRSRVMLMRVWM